MSIPCCEPHHELQIMKEYNLSHNIPVTHHREMVFS